MHPLRFRVVRMGVIAASTLALYGQGVVIAVFNRSFYCDFKERLVCIGSLSLGISPLNVLTAFPDEGMLPSLGLRTGLPVRFSGRSLLAVGDRLVLAVAGAEVWRPCAPPHPDFRLAKTGLEALEQALIGRLPTEGLAGWIDPFFQHVPATNPVLNRAVVPLNRLQVWLAKALGEPRVPTDPDLSSLKGLLGLGPGLTPSGDDLLGGIMLALKALNKRALLKTFSRAVLHAMDEQVNPISAAHLRASMDGTGCAAVHGVINRILSGKREKWPERLNEIDGLGHTSGWDMLTGIVIVFRLWLEHGANRFPRISSDRL